VSVSGFGQTGPLAHLPAYDIIVQAMSGLMEATGEPEGPPTMVGEAVSDVIAGLFASWATLAALLQQRRTGQGQHVDVAMFDATLAFLVTGVGRYLFTGESARRSGNRHSFSAPFGVYRARDGHFALAVLNNKLFATLAALIGVPGFAQDARFATDELRRAHEGELAAAIDMHARVLARQPDDVHTLVNLASLEIRRHDYAQAQTYLDQALVLAPQHSGALSAQADAWRFQHHFEPAIALLRQRYAQTPSLDLVLALVQLQADPQGQAGQRCQQQDGTCSQGWLLRHLEQEPSLAIAHQWLATQGEHAIPPTVLQALDHASRPLMRYRCAACGFEARQHFWQCPGCQTWDSYPARRVEEL